MFLYQKSTRNCIVKYKDGYLSPFFLHKFKHDTISWKSKKNTKCLIFYIGAAQYFNCTLSFYLKNIVKIQEVKTQNSKYVSTIFCRIFFQGMLTVP